MRAAGTVCLPIISKPCSEGRMAVTGKQPRSAGLLPDRTFSGSGEGGLDKGLALAGLQCLLNVGDDIVHVLDTDRDAHHIFTDTGGG